MLGSCTGTASLERMGFVQRLPAPSMHQAFLAPVLAGTGHQGPKAADIWWVAAELRSMLSTDIYVSV